MTQHTVRVQNISIDPDNGQVEIQYLFDDDPTVQGRQFTSLQEMHNVVCDPVNQPSVGVDYALASWCAHNSALDNPAYLVNRTCTIDFSAQNPIKMSA
jgi:hypothetical protein